MKKYSFGISIYGNGSFNEAIIRMITNHNDGKAFLTFSDIRGFIRATYCQYPITTPGTKTVENVGEGKMDIFENDKATISLHCVMAEEPIKEPLNDFTNA